MTIEKITEVSKSVPKDATTVAVFFGLYFLGGVLFTPIPLIAFATSLVFGIWMARLISIPGLFIACISGYLVGRFVDEDTFGETIGETIGEKIKKISKKVDEKGVWAIIALRVAPTPPFTLTSIIGGSLKPNFWKYTLGSTICIMPLALSAIFFGKGALQMAKEPSVMAATSLIAAIILYIVYRVIKKQQ
jgi:uncharacterized membrane protein YdjX (TVP38/TMEM64 family)